MAWDLVLLLADRRGETLDIAAIKENLAVDGAALGEALAGLTNAGLVSATESGWRLEPTPERAAALEEFLQATADVKGRQRVLTYFLQAQRDRR